MAGRALRVARPAKGVTTTCLECADFDLRLRAFHLDHLGLFSSFFVFFRRADSLLSWGPCPGMLRIGAAQCGGRPPLHIRQPRSKPPAKSFPNCHRIPGLGSPPRDFFCRPGPFLEKTGLKHGLTPRGGSPWLHGEAPQRSLGAWVSPGELGNAATLVPRLEAGLARKRGPSGGTDGNRTRNFWRDRPVL